MRNGKGCSNPKQQCEKHAPVLAINLHKNIVRSRRNRLLITQRQAYAQLLTWWLQIFFPAMVSRARVYLSPVPIALFQLAGASLCIASCNVSTSVVSGLVACVYFLTRGTKVRSERRGFCELRNTRMRQSEDLKSAI